MLKPSDYVNHSGGAYGADTLWDLIGREYGVTDHRHYKDSSLNYVSKFLKEIGVEPTLISDEQLEEGYSELSRIVYGGKKLDKNIGNNLKARNYWQVKNAEAVYAIGELNNYRTVRGGTSVAVEFGKHFNKPTYVYDVITKKWYLWGGRIFMPCNTPTLTVNFAGVGSRNVQNYSIFSKETNKWIDSPKYLGEEVENDVRKAIHDVYKKTFKV